MRATIYLLFFVAILLGGCASTGSSGRVAAAAKTQMVGLTREEVLACMGPPRKKASEGITDVWSYLSTGGRGTGYESGNAHGHSFCIVNIVMKSGIVSRVNYNGPASTISTVSNGLCGYAVANCVQPDIRD